MNKNKNKKNEDLFWFRDYVLFLKDKLDNSETSHVVGVHGDYWAWKTTTMNLIKNLYNEESDSFDNVLEFSAWRNFYKDENTVWKALLFELAWKIYNLFDGIKIEQLTKEEIWQIENYIEWKNEQESLLNRMLLYSFGEIKVKNIIENIKAISIEIQYNLYQELKDTKVLKSSKSKANEDPIWALCNIFWALPNVFTWKGFEKITKLSELLTKEKQELKKPKIDSLDVIQREFDILLGFYEVYFNKKAPLIIMIDDLDRILPEKSVEILEILRIFFEKQKRIHFIVAIDIRVIEKWIERKFNQLSQWGWLSRIEMEEYLEKIITLPFDLPAIPLVDNLSPDRGYIKWIDSLIWNKLWIELPIEDWFNNESKEVKATNWYYVKIVKQLNSKKDFTDIIKTWLQANPRKINRFFDVFSVYYKILIYRTLKKGKLLVNEEEKLIEQASLLAKMLIIKLERDEIYREFVKDKLYLSVLETIANNPECSFKITDLIKFNKIYKIQNLFGMLCISKMFIPKERTFNQLLEAIYCIYYLLPSVNIQTISENENIEKVFKFNFIRYLYENNEVKLSLYLDFFSEFLSLSDNQQIQNIIEHHKKELSNWKY